MDTTATNTLTATYSPEDNKLRLYSLFRLDKETYNRVKDAGFSWAPKQELFVAPAWTPSREDLLIELCGEIDDEDKTLAERQEERAERFEDYSGSRRADAESAHKAVEAITQNIPLGQPILIGHHSERHARKDQERIHNGMRKAINMWETADYWERRAKGALLHAQYKERPDVRARRIKKLEAEQRKAKRSKEEAELHLKQWTECAAEQDAHKQMALALNIANYCHLRMPRKEGDRPDFHQRPSAWDVLSNSYPHLYTTRTVQEVIEHAQKVYPHHIAHYERWISHYQNRIAYERAMLAEDGGTVSDKTGPEKGGAVQCWASHRGGWSYIQKVNKVSVTVLDNWGNGGGNFTRTIPFDKLNAIMTAAQVNEKREAGLLIETADKTGFMLRSGPDDDSTKERTRREQNEDAHKEAVAATEPEAGQGGTTRETIDALRDTLKSGGVKVVAVPQLFPTPNALALRMVQIADIQHGQRVLEPSAGTGVLIGAMGGRMFHYPNGTRAGAVLAFEINRQLADHLETEFPLTQVICADFLDGYPDDSTKVDRILMNPPFANGADIAHIKHAIKWLKPGGKLVAICANGPRQNEQLRPLADTWEDLEPGTFKDAGTMVNTALMTYTKR